MTSCRPSASLYILTSRGEEKGPERPQYYDKVSEMDAQVGEILTELAADNLDDSTIVFYYGRPWKWYAALNVGLSLIDVPLSSYTRAIFILSSSGIRSGS